MNNAVDACLKRLIAGLVISIRHQGTLHNTFDRKISHSYAIITTKLSSRLRNVVLRGL